MEGDQKIEVTEGKETINGDEQTHLLHLYPPAISISRYLPNLSELSRV